ncbi:dynactin subunit 4, putative [Plasmodium ovale wallikeri]|uniref:Dynactin subunit 4 n=1 Tax=Plasmodium ovale wallikeri TaxID=864142 RepID=A0A1A8ZHL1_PLAOA|nr:dynactin subunit 4, putative [Plasmodium ovale wallikeri]
MVYDILFPAIQLNSLVIFPFITLLCVIRLSRVYPFTSSPTEIIMKNKVYLLLDEKLFKLKELYFCVICSKIRNEFNLKKEVEYYLCNGCTQIYTKNESVFYSYECLRCFKCPFCFTYLTISHNFLDNSISSVCKAEGENDKTKGDIYPGQKGENDEINYKEDAPSVKDGIEVDSTIGQSGQMGDSRKDGEKGTNDPAYVNGAQLYLSPSKDEKKKENEEKLIWGQNCPSAGEYPHNTGNNLKRECINNSRKLDFFKKGEKLFYFKCSYCLWSSINLLANSKLDELIGDMILMEKNCVFNCYFRNVLNELIKCNEQLKKKFVKRTDRNACIYEMENFNSYFDENGHNNTSALMNRETRDFEERKEQGEDSSLICKSEICIEKRSLKDILNAEHVRNPEKCRDLFELEIEHVEYLDPIMFRGQADSQGNKETRKEVTTQSGGVLGEEEASGMEDGEEASGMEEGEGTSSVNGEVNTRGEIGEVQKDRKVEFKTKRARNVEMDNLIIHSEKCLSNEHMHDYPCNFYKGINELIPLRGKLLSKESKRCSNCKQYVLKLHNSNLTPVLRLDNNALKFIPRIYINDFRVIKKKNGILNFILINPLDVEMNIKIITEMEHNFLKHLSINKIQTTCISKSKPYEFVIDTYDEIIDELLEDEKINIKTVVRSEYLIIRKQNNMALVIISFVHIDNDLTQKEFYSTDKCERNTLHVQNGRNDSTTENTTKLNFPLTLECSFSDKSKKEHHLKLNLLFSNNITAKGFRHYALNDM